MTENVSEAPGVTEDAAVVVSRTVGVPVKDVWKFFMSAAGAEALLGPGAHLGEKGRGWASDDGHNGVVRTLHPNEEIRFSFRSDDASTFSMVKLEMFQQGDDTQLTITHDRLWPDTDLAKLTNRWTAALERIDEIQS